MCISLWFCGHLHACCRALQRPSRITVAWYPAQFDQQGLCRAFLWLCIVYVCYNRQKTCLTTVCVSFINCISLFVEFGWQSPESAPSCLLRLTGFINIHECHVVVCCRVSNAGEPLRSCTVTSCGLSWPTRILIYFDWQNYIVLVLKYSKFWISCFHWMTNSRLCLGYSIGHVVQFFSLTKWVKPDKNLVSTGVTVIGVNSLNTGVVFNSFHTEFT